MLYESNHLWLPQYEYVSCNQHGDRYKQVADKRVRMVRMTAQVQHASDLQDLIILSHELGVPVHHNYETKPQTAWIEIVAKEGLV